MMCDFRPGLLLCLYLFGVLMLVATTGCDRAGAPTPVVRLTDDDERMKQAIADAQASVSQFRAALENPGPGQTNFMIKYAAKDGDTTEHLWVTPVRADGGRFVGTVGNEPQHVSNVSAGQEVTIPAREIVDWMYVEEGKLVGGYTLRVIRSAMSRGDRREFDRNMPFRIE